MKERITVLLGAGAMIEATGVSTKSLTEKVISKCKKYKINQESEKSVVDVICDKFLSVYNKEISAESEASTIEKITSIISFEDIFHVLELLPNYKKNKYGYKGHISAYTIFSELNNEFEKLDMKSVYLSAQEIIDVINDEIFNYDCEFNKKGKDFKRFFDEISSEGNYKFDVFNLNYDTWMEQTLKDYNDGFIKIPEGNGKMQRFDINEYLKEDDRHTISHLHGQICFEYPDFKVDEVNRYVYKESHNTLYKYNNYNDAKDYRLRSAHSGDSTQSGENLFRTNIVTGLMKTDKLLWNPLNVYHNRFMNALLKNKRLILIGYGFSDLYINSLLYQYNAKHFEDRKMVMIDYVSDDDWQPTIEHPFYPSDKAIFTNLMHKSDHWYEKYMFKDKKNIIISEDNMVCICTSGFNSALNYIEKIKNFLK